MDEADKGQLMTTIGSTGSPGLSWTKSIEP